MTKEVTQFSVFSYDKPGALGKIADILGRNGYNISGVSTESMGDIFAVRFVADKETGVAQTLKNEGYQVLEHSALCVELANRPGALAEMSRILGKNNVNIWHVYGTAGTGAQGKIIITCDNSKKAKTILAKMSEKVLA